MNPLSWDAVQRLQMSLDSKHLSAGVNSTGASSRAPQDWDSYRGYPSYAADEPHSSMGADRGWTEPPLPSCDFYIQDSEGGYPDGEPLQMDEEHEEDPELVRKRQELREIEDMILRKKVAIALKKVEPLGMNPTLQLAECRGATLKERVNAILGRLQPASTLTKLQAESARERMKSSNLRRNGLLKEDHPLKLRVKALMRQRFGHPCDLPQNKEVPDLVLPPHPPPPPPPPAPLPPCQRSPSPAKEENSSGQGFLRFLSVLNKGVDMDFLSRIVNDDSDDLPLGEEIVNIQPPAIETNTEPVFKSERQRSYSEASLQGHSQAKVEERKREKERSLDERLSLHDGDMERNSNRRDSRHSSSCQSNSPPALKKKKEETPKVDEQQEHLQNILKTLGMCLEQEEIKKLAVRTQERLYGKKLEDRGSPESRAKLESPQRVSNKHDSPSPGSSSSSTSSYHTYDQEAIPLPHCPSGYPFPQNADRCFPDTVEAPNRVYPHHTPFEDLSLLVNPDLSQSEGQVGSTSGSRCLQVITTEKKDDICIKSPKIYLNQPHVLCKTVISKAPVTPKAKKKKRRSKKRKKRKRPQSGQQNKELEPRDLEDVRQQLEPRDLEDVRQQLEPRDLEEVWQEQKQREQQLQHNQRQNLLLQQRQMWQPKVQPPLSKKPATDEEIKAHLRKKLEDFNQKVRQNRTHPAQNVESEEGHSYLL